MSITSGDKNALEKEIIELRKSHNALAVQNEALKERVAQMEKSLDKILEVGFVCEDHTPEKPSVIYGHPTNREWAEIFLAAVAVTRRRKHVEIETGVNSMNRWQAWFAGTMDGTTNVLIGEGDTKYEAIADLVQRKWEKKWQKK